MIIKKYIVNSMNEAMERIRYELGKDAVIISQRKIRKSGVKGWFSSKAIEVTAAVDNNKNKVNDSMKESIDIIKKAIKNKTPNIQSKEKINLKEEIKEKKPIEKKEEINSKINDEMLKEMQEMKAVINDLVNKTEKNGGRKSKIRIKLEKNDLNDRTIKKILARARSLDKNIDEYERVRISIKKMIKASDDKFKNTVVLVGPTGVGKTTTVAKLAGKFALIEKKKVGLITIDTYRIGAVEQLKAYANIMSIPFEMVITLEDMENALKSMEDCDIVLIDTTGRSSKNESQIAELNTFIQKTNTDNIYLVVSSTTKDKDVEAIIEGYKVLNFNNVIITKLDETTTYGSILNILDIANKPLSFVTTGQNVPDDLKRLSDEEICKLVLGEKVI
ncbi:flagellar biosynthesis protein FlhF [Clostridium aestuarii]|uniref:Flagellar biosynthesis protein FlhF n=1 Tax=Clostridium aestuarii TaxID=338193 RepID=A0ABT4CZ86_9CLOT|nr:flagellar biosynthesis protein FlhF [Clostridium aestuarii]MCY6483697.1 flagellar biosynthesis protein FlhF [Clostridium aestuarii]